jgi:hypothetical protein
MAPGDLPQDADGHRSALGAAGDGAAAEDVRLRRLREDARRPMSVNLAEGIALSHKLIGFAGAARQTRRP